MKIKNALVSESVEVGPVGFFFTNVNRQMNLAGHSHTAWLTLIYAHDSEKTNGFPVFDSTVRAVEDKLNELTAKPFRDCTNEKLAAILFGEFLDWEIPQDADRWGGEYSLEKIRMAVQGVRDKIGHAHSLTVYNVEKNG
tara:strand:- start:21 stop:437 length:417 start_codon:yes stop_codon:yes gene_type:complete